MQSNRVPDRAVGHENGEALVLTSAISLDPKMFVEPGLEPCQDGVRGCGVLWPEVAVASNAHATLITHPALTPAYESFDSSLQECLIDRAGWRADKRVMDLVVVDRGASAQCVGAFSAQ